MANARWTLDDEINAYLEGMVPPADVIEELAAKRGPVEAAAPRPGDPAPAFRAERLSADGVRTGEFAHLEDFAGRPLALVFGSYTCPVFRGQIPRFNEIYQRFRERCEFLAIYTHEAHPEDGWQVDINHAQGVTYYQPTSADERAAIARICRNRQGLELPLALDSMDDSIDQLYAGAPERIYNILPDGNIGWRSPHGPFALDVLDDWEAALAGQAAAVPAGRSAGGGE